MANLVYVDTDVCRWHISRLNDPTITTVLDFNEFKNSNESPKVALFHLPYPYHSSFEERVLDAVQFCDKVAILCSELHDHSVAYMKQLQHPKIEYFICGFIDDLKTSLWMDWFVTTNYFYKTSNVLDQLDPYTVKSKTFDILLGQPKQHRDIVYNFIKNKNYTDQVIMTYLRDYSKTVHQQDESGWIWGVDGVNSNGQEFKWTVTPITYHGYQMSLSQVVPIDIFNQTAYSIITETNVHNHYTFFTEKTVKPILARRMFVAFAGQHYLKNLRSLGFKTFDSVIDESYDSIEDNITRWRRALEQVEYLITHPQEEILEKIKPIVEHNRSIMLEVDWYKQFQTDLATFLFTD